MLPPSQKFTKVVVLVLLAAQIVECKDGDDVHTKFLQNPAYCGTDIWEAIQMDVKTPSSFVCVHGE
jgi:hypothetical protein